EVLYWGADLGLPAHGGGEHGDGSARLALSRPGPAHPLIPSQGEGWYGRPALSGHWEDGAWRPLRFALTEPVAGAGADEGADDGGGTIVVRAADLTAGLALESQLELSREGVLRIRHAVTNTGALPYLLDRLAALMPVPAQAVEVLDFSGRWSRERSPQRAAVRQGAWVRENRRGRTGFDAGPLIAGTNGFGFRSGQVWGVHTAWSGNHVQYLERLADGGAVLGGGELLEPGEIRLLTGERYQTPWVYFVSGDSGLDELSLRLHRKLRARAVHPVTPRPVTLNIWEAVYFDHSLDRLLDLADKAALVG